MKSPDSSPRPCKTASSSEQGKPAAISASELLRCDDARLRLPTVLALVGCKKSEWWARVRDGRAPKAHKAGPRWPYWRAAAIREYLAAA